MTLALKSVAEQVVEDRRHLHMHPELAYQERETARFVADRLRGHGIEVRTGVAGTGVIGLIPGGKPGKTVLLRADMDALPIEEENDVPYRSRTPGVMHACGHDGHTAILLGAARVLYERRQKLKGTVKLVFQPAEEGGAGAQRMIAERALEDPPVDAVFGLHLGQEYPAGTINVAPGPILAAADRFKIEIHGKGGHAASPHLCVDTTLVAAHVTIALNEIVSREVKPTEPAVVTVGLSRSGTAPNVISERAELRGTVRTYDPELRQYLARRVEEVAVGVARAMRADATCDYSFGYPATINEPQMTELVRDVARGLVGADRVLTPEPIMGAEDFSYFLEQKPGCFYFLGTRNESKGFTYGHHHPRFDVDEEALPLGVELMVAVAERYLES